jgi:glycosyltransferase involved in cell wall biosynthesis
MPKIKLLYIHNKLASSEMANLIQVKSMCKAFSQNGIEVTLSLQTHKSNKKHVFNRESDILYDDHHRIVKYFDNRIDGYLNASSVRKTINETSPDYCYIRTPLILKHALACKVPIIMELHNYRLNSWSKHLEKYYRKLLLDALRKRQVIGVVSISEALTQFWKINGIPKSMILTAHDGFDSEMYNNPLGQKDARDRLGLPLEKKIVTYTGRLYKNRNIEHLLALAKTLPNEFFLVVGGPNREVVRLKKLAVSSLLNNIMFTGQVSHHSIPEYLYASDVLLALWSSRVPTINFCSPLKVFEYMASGRIIVAHGFPTIKEVLKHDHNALIVEPESWSDLIEKTGKALHLGYPSTIANQARIDVYNEYSWGKRAEQIKQMFFK